MGALSRLNWGKCMGMGKSLGTGVLWIGIAALLLSCQKAEDSYQITDRNKVTAENPNVDRQIGEGENRFRVLGNGAFLSRIEERRIDLAGTEAANRFLS